MKKLIKFDNHEEVQKIADKKYGGNFSLAVKSIVDIAISSDDFVNDVDVSKKPLNGEPLKPNDAMDFVSFLQSESAQIAGIPSRFVDAAMMGFDASSFNERFKMLLDCDTSEGREIVSNLIFDTKIITEQARYLKVATELASVHLLIGKGERKHSTTEREYQKEISDNFNDYFDDYSFVGSEWVTSDGADRIDILACCKKTDRDVVIELKLGSKSAHKQLRSYAYEFENPILINISEQEVKNKRQGIQYLTFSEIGI